MIQLLVTPVVWLINPACHMLEMKERIWKSCFPQRTVAEKAADEALRVAQEMLAVAVASGNQDAIASANRCVQLQVCHQEFWQFHVSTTFANFQTTNLEQVYQSSDPANELEKATLSSQVVLLPQGCVQIHAGSQLPGVNADALCTDSALHVRSCCSANELERVPQGISLNETAGEVEADTSTTWSASQLRDNPLHGTKDDAILSLQAAVQVEQNVVELSNVTAGEAEAVAIATEVRSELVNFELQVVAVGVIFGVWIPITLVLCPLIVWHQMIARKLWKSMYDTGKLSIGRIVAVNILVQTPSTQFYGGILFGLWIVAACTMYDLEFETAPQIVCAVLSTMLFVLMCAYTFTTIPVIGETRMSTI